MPERTKTTTTMTTTISKKKQDGSTRHRVFRACEQCRSKKSKCDGTTPTCSTCRGLGINCNYGAPPKRRGLVPGSHSRLERKVKVLESILGLVVAQGNGEKVLRELVERNRQRLVDGEECIREVWRRSEVMRVVGGMKLLEGDTQQGDEIRGREPFGSVESQFSEDMTPFDFEPHIQPQQGSNTRDSTPIPFHTSQYIKSTSPAQPIDPSLKVLSSPDTVTDVKIPENSFYLLDIYFTYTHVWFPILDKFNILRTLRSITQSQAQSQSIPQDQYPLLYAILALSTLQQPPSTSPSTSAESFYIAAQSLIFKPGLPTSLAYVQTLLLLSLYDIAQGQLTRAWLIIGHAGRVAIDIQLSTNSSESRYRGRTWLGCNFLEIFIAFILRRKPQLEVVSDVQVGEDGWEEWEEWKEIEGVSFGERKETEPAFILSTFNHLVGLSNIVNDFCQRQENTERTFMTEVLRRLESWKKGLPAWTETHSSIAPQVVHLHVYFASLVSRVSSQLPTNEQNSYINNSTETIINSILSFQRYRKLSVAPATFLHFIKGSGVNDLRAIELGEQMAAAWAGGEEAQGGFLRGYSGQESAQLVPQISESHQRQSASNELHPSSTNHFPPPSSELRETGGLHLFLDSLTNADDTTSASMILPPNMGDSETVDEDMLDYVQWYHFHNGTDNRDQEDLPEFMANLGYVGQFSPSSLFTSTQNTDPPSSALNTDDDTNGRHGLNTVLEQWLVDAVGANRT
jgi:hypothetical protein